MFLKPNYRMTRNFPSGIFHVVFDDLFETLNRTGVDEPLVNLSAKIRFNLVRNFMQKRNSTKLVIVFTSPLPSMKSGFIMLDNGKVARIAYNNGIGTTTSCVIAIELSNRLFLLLSLQSKMLMTILICYLFLIKTV